MRTGQCSEHSFINQKERHHDLENPGCLQLSARGELLVERDDNFESYSGEWWQGDGEGGDDIWDGEAVDVGASEGVGAEDCQGEEVLLLHISNESPFREGGVVTYNDAESNHYLSLGDCHSVIWRFL